jgi:hypothetical protein
MLAVALALSLMGAAAPRAASPFVGIWRAIDNGDGSLMRATFAGPGGGPFFITWTESYFSACDGRAGLGTGIGRLDPAAPTIVEADMRLKCLRTGDVFEWHQVWQYRPAYDVLTSQEDAYGVDTIWTRLGKPLVPRMDLRVNYGHDWVESFYEAGHSVAVKVTESDGITVKATIEVQTESKDYWGGEEGFQTLDGVWSEPAPDILPRDWVFAQVDNGQTAKVQVGDIAGRIDLEGDAITGTIAADWIAEEVNVDCMPWGAPDPQPDLEYDTVDPDGLDTFFCSWAEAWDIGPYQDVGVAYSGPDGHWVANAFFARHPRIIVSAAGDWFWTSDFNPGTLATSIYESQDADARLLWGGPLEADESGFATAGYDIHGLDLVPGNYLVISDGTSEKGILLEPISMEIFDTENDIMAGTAPRGREVRAVAGMAEAETQGVILLTADSRTGAWMADFNTMPFDITEEMRPWSFAQISDDDGDANEAGTPPPPQMPTMFAWLEWDAVDGHGWLPGSTITLTVGGHAFTQSLAEGETSVHFDVGPDHDLVVSDVVTMTDDTTLKDLLIPPVAITDYNLGAKTVSGTYDPNLGLRVSVDGMVPDLVARNDGTWTATFDELGPLMWGDAIQTDSDGDEAAATIQTPNPIILAIADDNTVVGLGWAEGRLVDLKILCGAVECYTDSMIVPAPSDVPWTNAVFQLGGFDLLAGHRIVMGQGDPAAGRYEKELLVSSIHVERFEIASQVVYGTGDPGARFFVRINGVDRDGTVEEDGTWSVFHEGLVPGVWGEAIEPYGEGGDETRDLFQAPNE